MTDRSRSLAGRTSFLWAAGFFVFGGLWLAARSLTFTAAVSDGAWIDAYYVEAHYSLPVVAGALFVLYGLVYFGLEQARRVRRRRLLGGAHFGLTLTGLLLAFLIPLVMARLLVAEDPVTLFSRLNAIAALGYAIALAGQGFFLLALLDAFHPEPDLR